MRPHDHGTGLESFQKYLPNYFEWMIWITQFRYYETHNLDINNFNLFY